jgi:hypothetical protein
MASLASLYEVAFYILCGIFFNRRHPTRSCPITSIRGAPIRPEELVEGESSKNRGNESGRLCHG